MKAKGLVMAGVLIMAACSRSGSLYGDVFVHAPAGDVKRAARTNVRVIPSTQAFERDWARAVAAFQEELKAFRHAESEAAFSADQARLAWTKALAARRGKYPRTLARERDLWNQVRAAEDVLFKARKRLWDVALKHEVSAESLVEKYRTQLVQTDENGHYVLPGLPVGKANLYVRFPVGSRDVVWFRPVQVRVGAERVDLTDANKGGWPFVP